MTFNPEQFVETLRLFVEQNSQDIFYFIENNRRPMELGSENQLFGRLMRELVLQFPLCHCENGPIAGHTEPDKAHYELAIAILEVFWCSCLHQMIHLILQEGIVNRKNKEDCKQARIYEVNLSLLLKSSSKYCSLSLLLSRNTSSGYCDSQNTIILVFFFKLYSMAKIFRMMFSKICYTNEGVATSMYSSRRSTVKDL